jgi:hypothetical protein
MSQTKVMSHALGRFTYIIENSLDGSTIFTAGFNTLFDIPPLDMHHEIVAREARRSEGD